MASAQEDEMPVPAVRDHEFMRLAGCCVALEHGGDFLRVCSVRNREAECVATVRWS